MHGQLARMTFPTSEQAIAITAPGGPEVLPLPMPAAQAHAQMEHGAHVGKRVPGLGVPATTFPTNDAPP